MVARPDHPAVRHRLRLATPIPLGDPQWTRKVLEMASDDIALLSDSAHVLGLGTVSDDYDPAAEDLFSVEFVDHYKWELRHADAVLMRTSSTVSPGSPARRSTAPRELGAVLARVFPDTPVEVDKRLWRIVETAMEQPHGTMIVVSERAGDEAARLASQCTRIEPVVLGEEMIRRVTAIDGAVLLDADGRCHAGRRHPRRARHRRGAPRPRGPLQLRPALRR